MNVLGCAGRVIAQDSAIKDSLQYTLHLAKRETEREPNEVVAEFVRKFAEPHRRRPRRQPCYPPTPSLGIEVGGGHDRRL